MKLQRKPKALIRIKDAMSVLQISRSSVRNEIFIHRTLRIANEAARRGPTAPIKLYQVDVENLARTWGIL